MSNIYSFNDLLDIISTLRGENGCPWDREQNIESIKKNVLEESYEVIEACDIGGMKLADELGDLLLQVVFISKISEQDGGFTIDDVTNLICTKLIRRHPHIFGDVKVDTTEKVLDNWEVIKREEKGISTHTEAMEEITKTLPSLLKAYKVQQKAKKAGFDWDDVSGALDKTIEETNEVIKAIKGGNQTEIEEEIGDLLFACVNVARFKKVNPELALDSATKKFIARFSQIEDKVLKSGKRMEDMTLSELDDIWNSVKAQKN